MPIANAHGAVRGTKLMLEMVQNKFNPNRCPRAPHVFCGLRGEVLCRNGGAYSKVYAYTGDTAVRNSPELVGKTGHPRPQVVLCRSKQTRRNFPAERTSRW